MATDFITGNEMIMALLTVGLIIQFLMMLGIFQTKKECNRMKRLIKPYMKSMWLENDKEMKNQQEKQEWKKEEFPKKELPKGIEFTPEEEQLIREVLSEYI